MTHSLRTTALDDLITLFFFLKQIFVCLCVFPCMHAIWYMCEGQGTISGTDSPFCLVWESLLLIAEYARQLTTLFVTCSSVKGRGSQAGGREGWPEVESVASQGLECLIITPPGPQPVSNLKNLEFCQPPCRMLTQALACYSKAYPQRREPPSQEAAVEKEPREMCHGCGKEVWAWWD